MKYKDSAKNNCSYPSVRAARASHTRLRQLGASRTGFYPSLNLRCEPHRLLAMGKYREYFGIFIVLLPEKQTNNEILKENLFYAIISGCC